MFSATWGLSGPAKASPVIARYRSLSDYVSWGIVTDHYTPATPPTNKNHIKESREQKVSPKFFRPKFFRGRPRGMSVPKCFFFQDLEVLTEVFGRMSAGISGQKLPLWAEFSFLRTLKTQTSLNKEARPFFLSDNSIWSLPSVSSLSDYSIWRS